jgi:hypothetical protein
LADAFPRLLGENYPATGQFSALHFGSFFPRMKTSSTVVVCLALTLVGAQAQNAGTAGGASQTVNAPTLPAPTVYQVTDRGSNYKVWQREIYEPGPNGLPVARLHQYKEIATGMSYKNSLGQYVDSQELIQSAANGAVALGPVNTN